MKHNIPHEDVQKHTKSISDTKTKQVSNLQNHIQEILGDTHHTFLQGSYKNDTSISDINDVDIVAVRINTYSARHSSQIVTSTTIQWDSIFSEIEQKLRSQKLYNWTVIRKDKCIEVQTSSFKADVVPAVQVSAKHTQDPIVIYSFKTSSEKVNSPRVHYENGVKKHQNTNQNYKPVVRMFKNWIKNHFPVNSPISSYHMESLVHGVDDNNFADDYALSFILVASDISDKLANLPLFPPPYISSVCGTENILNNWDPINRKKFVDRLLSSTLVAAKAYKENTIAGAKEYWSKAFNL